MEPARFRINVTLNPLYWLCQGLFQIGIRVYFRTIRAKGLRSIPKNKPVLLAINHTNAFLDSSVLHILLRRNVYSLARGDVFKNPVANYFLRIFHILPIFRLREGIEHLPKNNESFRLSMEVLERADQPLIIYPEGDCVQEYAIRPFRKGMARIAFLLEEKYNFESALEIVPVSLFYSRLSRWGGTLEVQVGKPLKVSPYKEAWQRDKARALNALTRDCEAALRQTGVHLPDAHDQALLSLWYDAMGSTAAAQPVSHWLKKLHSEADPHRRQQHLEALSHYRRTLSLHGLRHAQVVQPVPLGQWAFSGLLALLGAVPGLLGWLFFYLPFQWPAKKARALCASVEFVASVTVGLGSFAMALWMVVAALLLTFTLGGISFWAYLGVLLIWGAYTLAWGAVARRWYRLSRWLWLTRNRPDEAHAVLDAQRNALGTWL